MSEVPPFRAVRRGFDPAQVAAAMSELTTELAAARGSASELATELAGAQEREASLTEELRDTRSELAAARQQAAAATTSPQHGDIGARVAAILTLAVEEGDHRRADAEHYADEVRRTAEADAARMAAAATAAADGVLQQASQQAATHREAAAAHQRELAQAAENARREYAEEGRRLRAELDDTVRARDEIRDHLAGVLVLLDQLDGELAAPLAGASGSPTAAPDDQPAPAEPAAGLAQVD